MKLEWRLSNLPEPGPCLHITLANESAPEGIDVVYRIYINQSRREPVKVRERDYRTPHEEWREYYMSWEAISQWLKDLQGLDY